MPNDIIHILYDKANKIENSQVKRPTKISSISNNYKKRNEDNKKNFKKALVNAHKELDEEKQHHNDKDDVIISSSLNNLIYENSHLGAIIQEELAKNPRVSNILKDKYKINSEPLDKS